MDILLAKVTQQAMNYAIRSGVTITGGYAIKQCSRLLKSVDNSTDKQELAKLQLRLDGKIRIISPAIDMIELISARGNTSLESAVTLTKDIRWEIQSLGVRLAKAAGEEELMRRGSSRAKSKQQNELELKLIISDIKKLLERIEDAVPLINLAITTSGANLSNSLPATVSPSRLLQASTFLTAGDSQYSMSTSNAVQIGPTFTLSMYMLFAGHIRPHDEEGIRETTWKEVIHKARVKLMRIPQDSVYDFPSTDSGKSNQSRFNGNAGDQHPSHVPSEGKAFEFAYQLHIIEDLDDDRVHTFEEGELQPGPFEGVAQAGIREIFPIHEVSKIFYADTGKILNIGSEGEANSPILLLKRDPNAVPPRKMMERQTTERPWYEDEEEEEAKNPDNVSTGAQQDDQDEVDAQLFRESTREPEEEPPQEEEAPPDAWRLPPNLDPEWIAFEVYVEAPDSDDEDDGGDESDAQHTPPSRTPLSPSGDNLAANLSHLNLRTPSPAHHHNATALTTPRTPSHSPFPTHPSDHPQQPHLPAIRTSLSLLEMLIRLTALQQFQQASHLSIPDELLTFFLSESSTVGAGGDSDLRRRVRSDAARRVGFDPYDESPIKRRGEEYLEQSYGAAGEEGEWEDERGGATERSFATERSYASERSYGGERSYIREGSYTNDRLYPHSPNSRSGSSSARRSPLPHPDVPLRSREAAASASPLLRKAVRSRESGLGGRDEQGERHGRGDRGERHGRSGSGSGGASPSRG
ncbi:uncharacterized protein K452DRAFT_322450 [Aplosporella prunicola CBS 121167]|uniref:Ran-binding-domain-containing protein n=1 Tax=Aplosporella prunicola CBS 121167 TaxID=1176127 RepID=A0A6A6AXC1_9PEZI|nr:uncharacterized protein K452DRAFT_322450 [Aplosporella prunicola CBS 121167]KAF2136400.1 hypothetical protein K452DRAFT_322450 [Aplosporella prunicola CBS 121167]